MPDGAYVDLPHGGQVWMEYDKQYRIEKALLPTLPLDYRISDLSLRLGAKAVYRDSRARDSLQLREYEDNWLVQIDRFNPEAGTAEFCGHALTDALGVTLTVGLVLVAVGLLCRG